MARALASVSSRDLGRLLTRARSGDPAPEALGAAQKHQRELSLAMALWSASEAKKTRVALNVVEQLVEARRYLLAASLLRDLEAVNAPVGTFLAQLRLRDGRRLPDCLGRDRSTDNFDWQDATAKLIQDSLSESERRLPQLPKPAAQTV